MRNGFTLAELLIALAILGVIATFTIPKLMFTQQEQQKKAIFKETIAALSATVYNGSQTPGYFAQGTRTYLLANMNYVKYCTTFAEGCYVDPNAGGYDDVANSVLLHNGASIVDIDNVTSCDPVNSEGMTIDWNGINGPNVVGDDRLTIGVAHCELNSGRKPGRIIPAGGGAPNTTLWDSIFQ